jgi:hypothetical protein
VVNASQTGKSAEGRRAARVRTFLQARISYGDGAISTQCTVNQLSQSGARLTLPSTIALPDVFGLSIPQKGISSLAKLVWRNEDQAGIDFLSGEDEKPVLTSADYIARINALEAENAKLKLQIGALLQQVSRLTEE